MAVKSKFEEVDGQDSLELVFSGEELEQISFLVQHFEKDEDQDTLAKMPKATRYSVAVRVAIKMVYQVMMDNSNKEKAKTTKQ